MKKNNIKLCFLALLLLSCEEKNDNSGKVLETSINLMVEENRLYTMEIVKQYECSNKRKEYTDLLTDTWSIYELDKVLLKKISEIDDKEILNLNREIEKISKKHHIKSDGLSILSEDIKMDDKLTSVLKTLNNEMIVLKELKKKINCSAM